LFVVARENHLANTELFDAVGADIRMHPSLIVADRIRLLLRAPLLNEFVNYARFEEDAWACALIDRIAGLVPERVPDVWELRIDQEQAYALYWAWEQGLTITLGDLLRHPRARDAMLPAIVLMRRRGAERTRLPVADDVLQSGDILLLCSAPVARPAMRWTLQNRDVLAYVLQAPRPPQGWIAQQLQAQWEAWQRRRPGDSNEV
jgi:hypothetical protein